MKIASTKRFRSAAGLLFLAAASVSASAYAVDVSDLYVLRREETAAAGADDGAEFFRVDESNGSYVPISNVHPFAFSSVASDGGYGAFVIENDIIWYVSFFTGNEGNKTLISNAGWTGPTHLAYGAYVNALALVESLTAWQGGYLYKVDLTTHAITQLGATHWTDMAALTYFDHNVNNDGNDLFAIQADALWRININSGSRALVGNGDWSHTTAMATDGTKLYVACQDHLYTANPSTGSSVDLGGNWTATTSLTFLDGWLYAIDDDELYRVNPSTGSSTLLGNLNEWPGETLLTFRQYQLH